MAKTLESVATDEATITFELDRFEHANDERLEISGRWFGVRGRRFIRPSLTVTSDDGELRLLADLEHKPWAAEDGELWHVAFPFADRDLSVAHEVELTVSPDLTVQLPAEPAAGASLAVASVAPAARSRRGRQASPQHKPAPPARRTASRPDAETDASGREIAALLERVGSLTRELDSWRARSERELAEAQQAATDARRASERATAERDRALADRDRALVDSDAARAAAARAQAERGELADTLARLKLEHDQTVATHGAALVMRDSAVEHHRPGRPREIRWLTVAIALAMLIVVALMVAIALH